MRDFNTIKSRSGTEKSDIIAGWVAVAIYTLLVVLLFIFVSFNTNDKEKKEDLSSGILINFGNESPGYGKVVTRDERASKPKPAPEPIAKEPIVNDNADDAVIQATPPKPKVKPQPEPKPVKPVVNTNALYKKKTTSTNTSKNDTSHGSTAGRDGKTGSKDGEIGNVGGGESGSNFSLSGRSLIGSLSEPDYDERIDGQIVIEIQVDRKGDVISATYLPKNSTVSSRKIIEAVRQAAMKAKFNADNNAAFTQVGTITYILKVE